ncbi:MAG: gamma-glutamyltransferase family protein [Planctomycetes bacterium]|nr:gamma-glutamyltransferase family protein [Planctomycetota bacterium]
MDHDFKFRSRRSNVMALHGMVAASQPLAVQAGLQVLREGGNAADAAVATAAMLAVVEPSLNGVGGDCFALYWDAKSRKVSALNGSGRAAAGADLVELKKRGFAAMPRYHGASVTVPGAVRGWADLLAGHGSMPLSRLIQPAVETARRGYPVTEWIALAWAPGVDKLLRSKPGWKSNEPEPGPEQPSGAEMLLNGCAPRAGEVIKLPTLATTLESIAREGADWFYRGDFARKLAAHVQRYGGWLTADDLAAHTSTWDEPIYADYRGYRLWECPPNGQGLAAIIAANIAGGFGLPRMDEPDRLHIMVESMRLAFADAQRWVCDPAATQIPLKELCSEAYAAKRRALIDPARAAAEVKHGAPIAGSDTVYACAVDAAGNACSFIQSNYTGMGTGLVVPGTGVTLQNRGALFSLDAGHPNALASRKRPYHTIIPALTTRDNELHCCFGIMGGHMQPQAHLQMLVNMVDLGLNPQHALDMPRWQLAAASGATGAGEPGGLLQMEPGFSAATLAELMRRGHRIEVNDARLGFGGGQIIQRVGDVLIAGSDPRKDGCAAGW